MIPGSAVPTTVWSSANRNIASRIAPRISSLARGDRLSAAASAAVECVIFSLQLSQDVSQSDWHRARNSSVVLGSERSGLNHNG